jgi:hypothetical protein
VPALKQLQSRAASVLQAHSRQAFAHQEQPPRGSATPTDAAHPFSLALSGVGVSITSPAALHTLVTCAAACITRLPLLDLYPHAGTLPWSHLTTLTRLTHLAVVTGAQASQDKVRSRGGMKGGQCI